MDEFAISQLPLKKQNLLRKKAHATTSTFNWNSLYMNQDAVLGSTADRLGVSKSELLDPTSTDAAVKQAIAETHIISETKAYFAAHGANLDAFKSQKRGDIAILVKNIPFGTSLEELRKLFEEAAGGNVLQVLMPPSKTMAIVQFSQPVACRTAFAKLSYRRLGSSILFLEKAPETLFAEQQKITQPEDNRPAGVQKVSAADILGREGDQDDADTASLYVRNLNFDTTSTQLTDAFISLDGFVKAQVKTKLDPKKPGQVLSMGFGFVHFRSKAQAEAALKVMDGHVLDGHTLGVRASHKGVDAAEERRRDEKAKKGAGQRTKIVVKNLAFEASKADLRRLLGTYGKLRVVRIPKGFGNKSYDPINLPRMSTFTDRGNTDEDLPLRNLSRRGKRRIASSHSRTRICSAAGLRWITLRPRLWTQKRKSPRCRKRLEVKSTRWQSRSFPWARADKSLRSGRRMRTVHEVLDSVLRADSDRGPVQGGKDCCHATISLAQLAYQHLGIRLSVEQEALMNSEELLILSLTILPFAVYC